MVANQSFAAIVPPCRRRIAAEAWRRSRLAFAASLNRQTWPVEELQQTENPWPIQKQRMSLFLKVFLVLQEEILRLWPCETLPGLFAEPLLAFPHCHLERALSACDPGLPFAGLSAVWAEDVAFSSFSVAVPFLVVEEAEFVFVVVEMMVLLVLDKLLLVAMEEWWVVGRVRIGRIIHHDHLTRRFGRFGR